MPRGSSLFQIPKAVQYKDFAESFRCRAAYPDCKNAILLNRSDKLQSMARTFSYATTSTSVIFRVGVQRPFRNRRPPQQVQQIRLHHTLAPL